MTEGGLSSNEPMAAAIVRFYKLVFDFHGRILIHMGTVLEIENAVQQLSPEDLAVFRDWFLDFTEIAPVSADDPASRAAFEESLLQGWNEAQAGQVLSRAMAREAMAVLKEDWRNSRPR